MGRTRFISAGLGCCLSGEDEFFETPGLGIPNHANGGNTEDATRGSCDAFVGRRRALVAHNPALAGIFPTGGRPGSSARRIRGSPEAVL
jgi:hypothetical protein